MRAKKKAFWGELLRLLITLKKVIVVHERRIKELEDSVFPEHEPDSEDSKVKEILLVVAVIALVVLAVGGISWYLGSEEEDSASSHIKKVIVEEDSDKLNKMEEDEKIRELNERRRVQEFPPILPETSLHPPWFWTQEPQQVVVVPTTKSLDKEEEEELEKKKEEERRREEEVENLKKEIKKLNEIVIRETEVYTSASPPLGKNTLLERVRVICASQGLTLRRLPGVSPTVGHLRVWDWVYIPNHGTYKFYWRPPSRYVEWIFDPD